MKYTYKEAVHIYIGEYTDQFEVYKKYHNMEMTKTLFSETEKEEIESEENPPQWVIDAQKGK